MTRALCGALLATLISFPTTSPGQSAPEFAVQSSPTLLEVRGAATSSVHISILRAAAARYAPERDAEIEMTIVSPAPSSWSVITELALRIGIALEDGKVHVTTDSISIAGTTRDPDGLRRLQDRLSAVRQPDMRLESRVIEVSGERTPLSTFCRRQFYTLARDNRVRYIDRNGQLRSGAQAALDRLVELMHDCPDLHVGVLGRTDSTAGAVAGYLTAAGIDSERVRRTARPADPENGTTGASASRAADRDVAFELLVP